MTVRRMKHIRDPFSKNIALIAATLSGLKQHYCQLREVHDQLTLDQVLFRDDKNALLTAGQCARLFDVSVTEVIDRLNQRGSSLELQLNEFGDISVSLNDANILFADLGEFESCTDAEVDQRSIEIVRFLLAQPNMTDERIAFAADITMSQLNQIIGILEAERHLVAKAFNGQSNKADQQQED